MICLKLQFFSPVWALGLTSPEEHCEPQWPWLAEVVKSSSSLLSADWFGPPVAFFDRMCTVLHACVLACVCYIHRHTRKCCRAIKSIVLSHFVACPGDWWFTSHSVPPHLNLDCSAKQRHGWPDFTPCCLSQVIVATQLIKDSQKFVRAVCIVEDGPLDVCSWGSHATWWPTPGAHYSSSNTASVPIKTTYWS